MDKSIIFQKNTKQEALLIKILDHVQTIEWKYMYYLLYIYNK
jgi:hypothetical protein